MYTVENINTLAEMNNTVQENIIPVGSATKVIIIGVLVTDIILHSNKKICCIFTTIIVGTNIISSVSHKNILAVIYS
jgi:hypothetical protein